MAPKILDLESVSLVGNHSRSDKRDSIDTLSDHPDKYNVQIISDKFNLDIEEKNESLVWDDVIEETVKKWYKSCVHESLEHTKNSKYYKKIHYGLSIPSSILPLIVVSCKPYLAEYDIITTCLNMLTGILICILGIMNAGRESEMHGNFAHLYDELSISITSQLIMPRIHREDPNMFVLRLTNSFNSLNRRAPSN